MISVKYASCDNNTLMLRKHESFYKHVLAVEVVKNYLQLLRFYFLTKVCCSNASEINDASHMMNS